MKLTYNEALHLWARGIGKRPFRTGWGAYDYCYPED